MRRDLLVGTGLALVATFGVQGAFQWTPTWITAMLRSQGITEVTTRVSLVSMTLTTGNIVGSLSFPLLADRWGRKTALLIYFLECLLSVHSTFFLVQDFTTALITPSVMGFFVGRIFAGFAVYFPELFSTSIRATAHGFCYNSARLFSALAPFTTGLLVSTYDFFCACHHRRWTGLPPGSFHHCFFRARDQGTTSSRLVFITALLHAKYNAIYDALFHT
ncbi:MAG: MFS transporter [Candidatus Binatia bacterium]